MEAYDEVEIEDMDWDEGQQAFTYQCPCGDLFQITMDELADGEEIAHCPSCSLVVRVIYNPEDFQDAVGSAPTSGDGHARAVVPAH